MAPMSKPEAGKPFTTEDFEMVLQAVKARQENFPDEALIMSIGLVIFNIGERFSVVTCIEQEWSDLKMNIPPGEGEPKCPNGHTLTKGPPLVLGWLREEV